jgi:hypothetical protein
LTVTGNEPVAVEAEDGIARSEYNEREIAGGTSFFLDI